MVKILISPQQKSKEKLHLPTPNQYIASNFDIKTTDESKWQEPQQILKTDNGELWFKGDDKFNLPRGKVAFHFR